MNTTYAIHQHSVPWGVDSEGKLMSTDIVVEFVPEEGKPSYWYMPECVGLFTPECSMCGRIDLGEVTETGVLTDTDSVAALIKRLMGSRYGYNDRLRSNGYQANRAARGEF